MIKDRWFHFCPGTKNDISEKWRKVLAIFEEKLKNKGLCKITIYKFDNLSGNKEYVYKRE